MGDDERGVIEGGTLVRYTETEQKSGRWVNRGTVVRVKWRAIPDDPEKPIGYFNTRRDAVEYLKGESRG